MSTETAPTTPPVPETPPVVSTTPLDPADAGGAGNSTERTIRPGTLSETAEEARAHGSAWRRA